VRLRPNDPVYELALMCGGHRKEDHFWAHTLTAVARYLGVADPTVSRNVVCVDDKRQWRHWTNVWHNAAIRSLLQAVARTGSAVVRPLRHRPAG
jgi:hypothetical protein